MAYVWKEEETWPAQEGWTSEESNQVGQTNLISYAHIPPEYKSGPFNPSIPYIRYPYPWFPEIVHTREVYKECSDIATEARSEYKDRMEVMKFANAGLTIEMEGGLRTDDHKILIPIMRIWVGNREREVELRSLILEKFPYCYHTAKSRLGHEAYRGSMQVDLNDAKSALCLHVNQEWRLDQVAKASSISTDLVFQYLANGGGNPKTVKVLRIAGSPPKTNAGGATNNLEIGPKAKIPAQVNEMKKAEKLEEKTAVTNKVTAKPNDGRAKSKTIDLLKEGKNAKDANDGRSKAKKGENSKTSKDPKPKKGVKGSRGRNN